MQSTRFRRLAARVGLGATVVAASILALIAMSGTPGARTESSFRSAGPEGQIADQLPRLLPPSRDRVFYVDAKRGDDSSTGRSPATAWATVQKALSALQPGQKALVRDGTYRESLLMNRSGKPSAPISVVAYPGEKPVLQPASPDSTGNAYPVRITGSYFRLRGFVIEKGTGTSNANVYFFERAHHVELSFNEIRFGQDQGIFADDSTSALHIIGNRIHDNGWGHESGQHQSHGIYIEGRDHLIANNVIYSHPEGFGLHVWPTNRNTIITDNTVVRSGQSGIVVGRGDTFDIQILNNILAHNDRFGIEPNGCPDNVVVHRNVFFENGRGGVRSGCPGFLVGSNLNADPRFVDLDRMDLRLRRGSPAIGRADASFSPHADALGLRRPAGPTPDIGAFEYRAR